MATRVEKEFPPVKAMVYHVHMHPSRLQVKDVRIGIELSRPTRANYDRAHRGCAKCPYMGDTYESTPPLGALRVACSGIDESPSVSALMGIIPYRGKDMAIALGMSVGTDSTPPCGIDIAGLVREAVKEKQSAPAPKGDS